VLAHRKLIARWLWNVDAVRRWEISQTRQSPLPRPEWWTQERENNARKGRASEHQVLPFDDFIGEFVGQGRQIGYHGLAYAVIQSAYDRPGIERRMRPTEDIAAETLKNIQRVRPMPWWILTVTSLAIVWLEVGMAVMLAYNTPTVGISCRSGFILIFGVMSSLTWFLQLLPTFRRPSIMAKALCHALNLLSVLSLIVTIFAAVSFCFIGFIRELRYFKEVLSRCLAPLTANATTVQRCLQQLHLQNRIQRVYGLREYCVLPRIF
jgi:hypothetical protein